MTLTELAMAVCLTFNNLPCDDIQVSDTEPLAAHVNGLTHLYSSGRVEVKIRPGYLQKHGEARTRALLVHEFAHAQTYLQGEIRRGHTSLYRKNCRVAARKLGTPVRECLV